MKRRSTNKNILIPILIFAATATIVSLWLNLSYAASAFLFWGVPGIYFTVGLKGQNFWRILLFSLLVSTTIGPVLDYLALVNNAWLFQQPLTAFHVIGPVMLDDCLWLFFFIWGISTVFEAISGQKSHPLGPRFLWGLAGLLTATAIGHAAIVWYPDQIRHIPYVYLLINVFLLAVPLVLFLKSNRRYRKDFVRFTLYFLPAGILSEIVGLRLGQWMFPSSAELIGRLPFISQRLPIEELFFITLAAPAIMAYYVFLMRDPHKGVS